MKYETGEPASTPDDGRTVQVETMESLTAKAFEAIRGWLDGGIYRSIAFDVSDGRSYMVLVQAAALRRVYESKDYHFCPLEKLIETALTKFGEEAATE